MHIRTIFLALEIVLLIVFLVPFPVFCMGNIAGLIASVILMLTTVFWIRFKGVIVHLWGFGGGKVGLIILGLFILTGLTYVTVLSVKMYKAMKNQPKEADIIIVLGCQVRGDRPTRMLRRRLDVAYDFMIEHTDVMCIVSGGQGSDEIMTEALAMKNYLVDKGISADRIIMEDRSTSTQENLLYSLEIIDELGLERNVTIASDGFHQYRAQLMAYDCGATDVHALSASTEPRYVFTYWVREWFGLFKYQAGL